VSAIGQTEKVQRDNVFICAAADCNPLITALETSLQTRNGLAMTRVTRRSWTPEQIELLRALLDKGTSALRASVVLKRPKLAIQNKARQLGKPFPDVRDVKAARLAREAIERNSIER
jgi:hypothetical protein